MRDSELAHCAFVFVGRSDSVSVSESVGLSACVFDLTASPDSESEIILVSSRASRIFCGVSQTLSFSEKRGAVPCCVNNPTEQE